jgi:chromosome segregation ATPase
MVALTMSLTGCKKNKQQKALAEELAQTKAEIIKLKAETVQWKSEISYLNEKLVTANQARDNMQMQLDMMIKDSNAATTEVDDLQHENDKLRKLLAEQLKKNNDLEKQIETLKTAIRTIQARIESKTEPNKIAISLPHTSEETSPDVNQ